MPIVRCVELGQRVVNVTLERHVLRVPVLVHHARNVVAGVRDHERIGHNGRVRNDAQNAVPGADVFDALGERPARLRHHFESVQADFGDVIEQSEQRSEREGGHEERDETVLENCGAI